MIIDINKKKDSQADLSNHGSLTLIRSIGGAYIKELLEDIDRLAKEACYKGILTSHATYADTGVYNICNNPLIFIEEPDLWANCLIYLDDINRLFDERNVETENQLIQSLHKHNVTLIAGLPVTRNDIADGEGFAYNSLYPVADSIFHLELMDEHFNFTLQHIKNRHGPRKDYQLKDLKGLNQKYKLCKDSNYSGLNFKGLPEILYML